MKTIAFFNNKGGVGKTSLVYHLAWMYAELGVKVIAADLDPQANLTSMFLNEDRLESLWPDGRHPQTIYGAIQPLTEGTGDINLSPHVETIRDFTRQKGRPKEEPADIIPPHVENIGDTNYVSNADNIGLIAGDLKLSSFEDDLSDQWFKRSGGNARAFRVISAFYRVLYQAAQQRETELVLIDVGPNLGAINRSAMVAADYVVVPLAPDLFSLQGLRNLGPTLHRWRGEWREPLEKNKSIDLNLPSGDMQPAGYVVLQHAMRMDRPVKAYGRWMAKIPGEYDKAVLNNANLSPATSVESDPNCLATLKNYRSLMPLAMEAGKPMFLLKNADGALGSHQQAVQECFKDFKALALKIAERCNVDVPSIAAA